MDEKQLKARISNLEKSYEVVRVKCNTLEEERGKLENENKKLLDELQKMKN
jgi:predicted nuclease with TOPRIM domain